MTSAAVLLTGFEPFDGEPVNPSAALVEDLAARGRGGGDPDLHTAVLPVDAAGLWPALEEALDRARPRCVVGLGLAAGRAGIHFERRAVNRLRFGAHTDRAGRRDVDEPLVAGGPEVLPATLPNERLVETLGAAGHPVTLSDDAGCFLCNALLYRLLHDRPSVAAGFVHLPLTPERARARNRGEPSLPLDVARACLDDLLGLLGSVEGRNRCNNAATADLPRPQ